MLIMSRGVLASSNLAFLTAIVGYAVLDKSDQLGQPVIPLLLLGLAGLLCSVSVPRPGCGLLDQIALWSALLFPAYVAFQLLPLPLLLLRILDPTRAEIADAAQGVLTGLNFAPISIVPEKTWLHLSRIVGYSLIFLIIRQTALRFPKKLWALAAPIILIGALEASFGLSQRSAGGEAISGTYWNRDHFSGLLEMVLPFALMYGITIFHRKRDRHSFAGWTLFTGCVFIALSIGIFVAITLSLSKMGFLSTLGSLFAIGALTLASRLSGWRKWPALAGLAALAVFVFVFLAPVKLIEGFGSVAGDPSAEGRRPIAKDTLHMFAAYPLFGAGLGTFSPGLLRYETYGFNVAWANAHDDYLELLAELGVLGFLIPAALMCAVLARAARTAVSDNTRETRYLGFACSGGIAAMLIHSFGDFNMFVPANAMVLSWISGISAGLPDVYPTFTPDKKSQRRTRTATFVRGFAFALGGLLSIYSVGWLVFLHSFKGDTRAERVFCRFGICNTDQALAALQSQHGGNVASVPRADLLEFLRRDPAGPNRWCDLGDSLQKSGDIKEARFCFARALVLAPRIPYINFRAAQFHFNVGENKAGLELMAHALEGDPTWDHLAFQEYEDRRIDVDHVLRYGLPRDPQLYHSYLRRLISQKRVPEGAWDWIVSHGYADDDLANEYVEFLVRGGTVEAAEQAWAHYAGGRDKGYPKSNRVFNGDFESDPTGSRFDWRIDPAQGAAVDFDRDVHYSGARSLRTQFDGTQNVSNIGVSETVFLKPGRYRFQAYIRTRDISTDEGVAFSVVDPEAPKRLSFTTESMLGSNDWKLVDHAFQVLPGTGLVQVSLVRKPSLRFDSLIRGTVWIDHVSISP